MTKFVERKLATRRYDYASIITTATNGKAIEIPISPENRCGTVSNISTVLLRRGYRSHTSYNRARKVLIVWCEKI